MRREQLQTAVSSGVHAEMQPCVTKWIRRNCQHIAASCRGTVEVAVGQSVLVLLCPDFVSLEALLAVLEMRDEIRSDWRCRDRANIS
jgi:hypothetical protein